LRRLDFAYKAWGKTKTGQPALEDVMTKFTPLMFAGLAFIAGLMPVQAADLAEGRIYREAIRYCRLSQPISPILTYPEVEQIELAVVERLDYSAMAAEDNGVIFNRSPAYIWANETKAYCGQALGYLHGGAVEAETISKCDCFYSQLRRFMRR
jgi:hypothetical protein